MKKFLAILILAGLVLPVVIVAQMTPLLPNVDFLWALEKIADMIFWILIVAVIIAVVWAGLLFVTAAGNTDKIEQARHIILYAVIGLVVALLAYGLRAFLLKQIGGI